MGASYPPSPLLLQRTGCIVEVSTRGREIMSYCRTGADSDVYVFGGRSEIECYVAHNRGSYVQLLSSSWAQKVPPGLLRSWLVRLDFSRLNSRPLRNEHKGKSYSEATPQAMVNRLSGLREDGLKVPQSAIDRLLEEAQ
jgi:hypothetical protein